MRTAGIIAAAVLLAAGVSRAEDAAANEAFKNDLQKHLSIGSVVKTDFRDEQDQKFERIKLITEQAEDNEFLGTMRFTVEITDKAGETRWGQVLRKQNKHPAEYEGKDEWTFDFPHGELDKPKITAYALEYGWETNKVFTPVVQDLYKVETADEITARNKDPKKKLTITVKTKGFNKQSSGE